MKYQFTNEQCKEIEVARKSNKNKNIERRLMLLFLKSKGGSYKEIMTLTGFKKSNVARIIKEYFENGLEWLVSNKYTGNHRNLSYEEEAEILEHFAKKAEEGQIIEVKEIKAEYEKRVGHSIGGSQIYYVLSRHGWRKIMPRSRHTKKASQEAINASKKLNKL